MRGIFSLNSEVKTADDTDSADQAGLAVGRGGGIQAPGDGDKSFSIRVMREICGSYFGGRVKDTA
jgi:hypothetical protein